MLGRREVGPGHHRLRRDLRSDGRPRPHYRPLVTTLEAFTQAEIDRRERLQKISLVDQGITFTVYGEKDGIERISLRLRAAHHPGPGVGADRGRPRAARDGAEPVHHDVYQDQKCLKDRVIPPELVLSRREYKRELLRVTPPRQIYTHVVGTDIIRDDRGEYLILGGQLPLPERRVVRAREPQPPPSASSRALHALSVRPIRDYPRLLLDTLLWAAPRGSENRWPWC